MPEGESPRAPSEVFEAGVPVLGICYGQMAMCAQLGGEVEQSDHREFGRAFVDVLEPCALFQGVWAPGAREQVWMSHGDRVIRLPPGFRVVGTSEGAPFAAFADDARRFLRGDVPPGDGAHAARRAAFAEFHPRGRRLPRRLDDGEFPRHRDRPHPRGCRRRAGDLRGCPGVSICRWRRC